MRYVRLTHRVRWSALGVRTFNFYVKPICDKFKLCLLLGPSAHRAQAARGQQTPGCESIYEGVISKFGSFARDRLGHVCRLLLSSRARYQTLL